MSHNVAQRSAIGVRRSTRRAIIIATAAAANGLAWVAGRQAYVDYVLQTPLGPRQITVVLVILATTISGLAGWAAYGMLEWHTGNVVRAWIVLAVVVLALSIVPIFVLRAELGTRLALTALHCLATAILIVGLPQTSNGHPRSFTRIYRTVHYLYQLVQIPWKVGLRRDHQTDDGSRTRDG